MTGAQGPRLAELFPDAAALGDELRGAGLPIAAAESCTGGLLGAALTAVPGSSKYVRGGVITYSDELKTALLGVPRALIADHGAASEPVARAMAQAVRKRCGSDIGVAITGIAGPTAEGSAKEVGLIHVAVATPGGMGHLELGGDLGREANRARAVASAISLCRSWAVRDL
ncbi:MAG: CinA family protein [Candidatus Dormibacteria bacterium]